MGREREGERGEEGREGRRGGEGRRRPLPPPLNRT